MKSSFLETIKILDGKVYNIDYHQRRYERVCNSFGRHPVVDLSSLIEAPLLGLCRCRIVYSLDGLVNISYHPYTKRDVTSLKIIHTDSLEYPFKYENREEINQLYDLKERADDILIVKKGLICDTSIANIAFFDGKSWLTPKQPLLKGTTRERFLENAKIIEADIRLDDLKSFSQVALLNAMIDFDIISNMRYINEG